MSDKIKMRGSSFLQMKTNLNTNITRLKKRRSLSGLLELKAYLEHAYRLKKREREIEKKKYI